jgi:two-component system KDP operon response regulator KdpE
MTRLLVVDDEPQLLRTLQITLRAHGHQVLTAPDGRGALAAVAQERPELVVLDLGLPDLDGVDVVRQLRGWTPVPIVVLSGRHQGAAKVAALDAGADDYVTKPFDIEELLARIRAVTRRLAVTEPTPPVRLGRFSIDLDDRTVTSGSADGVHLTPTEWQLLDILARNPDRLISQRRLLTDVWGPTYVTQTHYLRQYMKHLRRKLEDDPARPRHLITEPGMGYRFRP